MKKLWIIIIVIILLITCAFIYLQLGMNKETTISPDLITQNISETKKTPEPIETNSQTTDQITQDNSSQEKTINESLSTNETEGGAGAAGPVTPPTTTTTTPSNSTPIINPEIDLSSFQYSAELIDVTDGEQIYTVNTAGLASGIAYAKYDGEYEVYIELYNLPQTIGLEEYAVWIAKIDDGFTVKKIGSPEYLNDKHILTYTTINDYTDHNYIVVTIESDGNSINPGDHILNGEFLVI